MMIATDRTVGSTDALVGVGDVTSSHGDVPALNSVSLDAAPGGCPGLVGPNGSGESTLPELVPGIRRPDEGRVCLFGKSADEFDAGGRVGYVAQNATNGTRDVPIAYVYGVAAGGAIVVSGIGVYVPWLGVRELRRAGRISGGRRFGRGPPDRSREDLTPGGGEGE